MNINTRGVYYCRLCHCSLQRVESQQPIVPCRQARWQASEVERGTGTLHSVHKDGRFVSNWQSPQRPPACFRVALRRANPRSGALDIDPTQTLSFYSRSDVPAVCSAAPIRLYEGNKSDSNLVRWGCPTFTFIILLENFLPMGRCRVSEQITHSRTHSPYYVSPFSVDNTFLVQKVVDPLS